MTKLLNLDALVAITRSVTISGKDYPLAELTVDQMIKNIEKADKAEKAQMAGSESQSASIMLTEMRKTCSMVVPTCPVAKIGALTLRQLTALVSFASAPEDDIEDIVKKGEAEGEVGKQK